MSMDDLISRKAAIDALNQKKIYRPLDSDRYVISDCLNTIVNLPSAQQWIPINEQMPPLRTEVLATSNSYVTIAEWCGGDKWFIQEGSSNAITEDVEAWMELPKPYEVEE